MTQKQKLELTWIEKENRPRLEQCILLENPGKAYHPQYRRTDRDLFNNNLAIGNNPVLTIRSKCGTN
jgi:adenine-specific DNA-methyltransferase